MQADLLARREIPNRKAAPRAVFPLSNIPLSASQHYWLDREYHLRESQWLAFAYDLTGWVNTSLLLAACERFQQRNSILRTIYRETDGKFIQRIVRATPATYTNLEGLETSEQEDIVRTDIADLMKRPQLVGRPPITFNLYRLSTRRHMLAGAVHHIAMDLRSMALMNSGLFKSYRRMLLGSDRELEIPRQFREYCEWEAARKLDPSRSQSWDNIIRQTPPLEPFGPRSSHAEYIQASDILVILDGSIVTPLKKQAQALGATVQTLLLGLVCAFLAKRTQRREALIGFRADPRPPAFFDCIGCFAQLRPFLTRFEDEDSVVDVARRGRLAMAEIMRPAGVLSKFALESHFDNVGWNYTTDGRNSIDRALPLHTTERTKPALGDLGLQKKVHYFKRRLIPPALRDLRFSVVQAENEIRLTVYYPRKEGRAREMEAFFAHFIRFLTASLSSPSRPISESFTSTR